MVLGVLPLLFLDGIQASPCPRNAVFLYSHFHSGPYCVCAPGLACVGRECSVGSDLNINSFRGSDVGYPWTCTECRCKPVSDHGDENTMQSFNLATNYPDYPDALFEQTCQVERVSSKLPRALPNATWIHFP
eukprot:gene11082-3148_t